MPQYRYKGSDLKEEFGVWMRVDEKRLVLRGVPISQAEEVSMFRRGFPFYQDFDRIGKAECGMSEPVS